MAILHSYRHLVVKNGNFTLLLTSSGQELQFLVQCIYIEERWTPPGQLNTDALHTGTLYIYIYLYMEPP